MIDFIFFLIIYFVGYLTGYFNGKAEDSIKTIIDKAGNITHITKNRIKELSKTMTTPSMKTGIIKPPTAKQLADRKLPPEVKEGIQAMKETLDSIPELAEHKRLVEEFKRESKGIYG